VCCLACVVLLVGALSRTTCSHALRVPAASGAEPAAQYLRSLDLCRVLKRSRSCNNSFRSGSSSANLAGLAIPASSCGKWPA